MIAATPGSTDGGVMGVNVLGDTARGRLRATVRPHGRRIRPTPPRPFMTQAYREFYRGRRVLITGGLGFIGSNLARALVDLDADVLIVDSLLPDYGGNFANIAGFASRLRVNIADVRQGTTMNYLVRGRDVIFNLAGQVSHIDSMRDPHTDLEINCRSQLTILESCRQHNPATKVVFAGTRQIYGKPERLPVDETHLVRPTDINGINKAAGEYYHLVYNNVFGVRACSLRLTNVYGPRQLIRHNRQGFIGWFIRLALEGKEIQIYGDGSQVRDFVFVDDVADAFLRAGATDDVNGDVFNVGGTEPISHSDLVAMLIDVAGQGSVKYVEWPEEKRRIDIGSFYSDSTKFMRATGWQPKVSLRDGFARTFDYYRAHFDRYVGAMAEPAAL
jgi:UDP-glucose 4-epimerase